MHDAGCTVGRLLAPVAGPSAGMGAEEGRTQQFLFLTTHHNQDKAALSLPKCSLSKFRLESRERGEFLFLIKPPAEV